MRLHSEWRTPRLSRWDRFREWLGFHKHRAVHEQWDMDEPSWDGDPYAIYTCSCGLTRHMWGGSWWGDL